MAETLNSKLKRLWVQAKKREDDMGSQKFHPKKKPDDAHCPYDDNFCSALCDYTQNPTPFQQMEVLKYIGRAVNEGYSIRPYLNMIKDMCDEDQNNA